MHFQRNLPLLLWRCSYKICVFARDLSILRVVDIIYAFSHQICLFLRVVDIIYAFSRDTYPYYYGDVVKIYAFSHEICQFLRFVVVIYAFS